MRQIIVVQVKDGCWRKAIERLITHLDNLKRFEPPLKIQGFTKTLIWHERTHKDPAYRWVRELIEKACAASVA